MRVTLIKSLPKPYKAHAIMLSRLERQSVQNMPSPKVKPSDVRRANERYMQLIIGDEKHGRHFWKQLSKRR